MLHVTCPHWLFTFYRREDGATAIEYGLIAAMIVAVVAVALPGVGNKLIGLYQQVVAAFQ